MTDARTVVADPALGFSYQVVLDKDARRTIVFQAHVSVSASLDEVNEVLDKIGKAADRQCAIYELQEARQFLEDHKRASRSLALQMENMEALAQARYEESGRKGAWSAERMSPLEQSARNNLTVSIERYREGIEKYSGVVARLQPLVNGHADGSANCDASESDR